MSDIPACSLHEQGSVWLVAPGRAASLQQLAENRIVRAVARGLPRLGPNSPGTLFPRQVDSCPEGSTGGCNEAYTPRRSRERVRG
jgi:hypothetical protein